MIEIRGDLFSSNAEAIGHGTNTTGLMLKGIGRIVRDEHPALYEEYQALCKEGLVLPGSVFPYRVSSSRVIINIMTQQWPGPDARLTWVYQGVSQAIKYCEDRGLTSLAIPRLGCGVGGLLWEEVRLTLLDLEIEKNFELEVWCL